MKVRPVARLIVAIFPTPVLSIVSSTDAAVVVSDQQTLLLQVFHLLLCDRCITQGNI